MYDKNYTVVHTIVKLIPFQKSKLAVTYDNGFLKLKRIFLKIYITTCVYVPLDFLLDVDECIESNNPCPDTNTICVNTEGAYKCMKSLSLANLLPLPPIEKNPTKDLATRQKDMRRTCSAGYKPANDSGMTCIDVDECNEQLHSCEQDERCVNELGSYRCENIAIFARKIKTKNLISLY